ncbi:MAG TPA: ABC transporter permease [Solirubrobacteraceae bacterium]|nr:ABC transporter permease [Solirubrobacteraceae bacterium]
MSDLALTLRQMRYDQKGFWRNPQYVFFTVIQPLIFLFIFVSVFGNKTTLVDGHLIKRSTYYVPAILTLAVMSATFFNLTISLSRLREAGILKRVRSTPLPPGMFLAGRIGTSITVSFLLVVLMLAMGRFVYGVTLPTHTALAGVVTVLVGAAALSCLAFAVTAFVPSEDAAAPIANVIMLPLMFISGIFIPNSEIPASMQDVANVFPVKHIFEALLKVFDPATTGSGLAGKDLAVIALWGVAGALVAIWRFRWTPSGE